MITITGQQLAYNLNIYSKYYKHREINMDK